MYGNLKSGDHCIIIKALAGIVHRFLEHPEDSVTVRRDAIPVERLMKIGDSFPDLSKVAEKDKELENV